MAKSSNLVECAPFVEVKSKPLLLNYIVSNVVLRIDDTDLLDLLLLNPGQVTHTLFMFTAC